MRPRRCEHTSNPSGSEMVASLVQIIVPRLALLLASAAAAPNTVKTVHVINSCHLDIGFANSSAGIVNLYFDHHLPTAAAVGATLAKGGVDGFTDHKLNFMFREYTYIERSTCPPLPAPLSIKCHRLRLPQSHGSWISTSTAHQGLACTAPPPMRWRPCEAPSTPGTSRGTRSRTTRSSR